MKAILYIIISNLIIEFIKWIAVLGTFDINDIILRIIFELIIIKYLFSNLYIERSDYVKKIILPLLIFSLITFIGNANVSAKKITITESGNDSAPSSFYKNPSDVLDSNAIKLDSLSVPTKYWNLSFSAYTGNLVSVGKNWLYTNYYFSSNNNGTIYLDYNIQSVNSNGVKTRIGLYNRFDKQYTTACVPTGACLTVSGLNKNQHYAFVSQKQ